jgi:hypothetical protein
MKQTRNKHINFAQETFWKKATWKTEKEMGGKIKTGFIDTF